MTNQNWIQNKLGVSSETLLSYCNSAYLLQINPLIQLRRRFPLVSFSFQRSDNTDCNIEIDEEINTVIVSRIKAGGK